MEETTGEHHTASVDLRVQDEQGAAAADKPAQRGRCDLELGNFLVPIALGHD